MKIFNKTISLAGLRDKQMIAHRETLLIEGTVPAAADGGTLQARINLSIYGAAFSLRFAGNFTTLASVSTEGGAVIVDDGVCHLRGRLEDTTGDNKLFSDYIPLDLMFSPGRRRSSLAVNNIVAVAGVADLAAPAGIIYEPSEFEYLFDKKGDIILDVKNDSNTPNSFSMIIDVLRVKK